MFYLLETSTTSWVQGGAAVVVAGAIIAVVTAFLAYIRHRDNLDVERAEAVNKAFADTHQEYRAMLTRDLAEHHQRCHAALDRVCGALGDVQQAMARLNGK